MGFCYALLVVAIQLPGRIVGESVRIRSRECQEGGALEMRGTLTLNLLMSFCPGEALFADRVELKSSAADSSKVLVRHLGKGVRPQAGRRGFRARRGNSKDGEWRQSSHWGAG